MKHEQVDKRPAPAAPRKVTRAKWSMDSGTVVIRLTPRLSRQAIIVARVRQKTSAIACRIGQSVAALLALVSTRRRNSTDHARDAGPTPTARILRFRRPLA